MAGPANNLSRMNITLQGYDQVVALSQANINETLRRHFSSLEAKDELERFEAETDLCSIDAEVLPPTIELVDKDNEDGALYIIHLGEGSYKSVSMTKKKDGEKSKAKGFSIVEIPTDGWELAFDVDFAFKPKKDIPPEIKRQVPLPGGYSVDQLMINFGDVTRILQLDRKRSRFPIPEEIESKSKIDKTMMESGVEIFLKTYLQEKLMANEDRNVLGFAVKLDEAPKNSRPTFIPRDCKVQIVGHRAGDNKESFRPDNPYNAFCFTEMCSIGDDDKRAMPSKEIQYSGNWFYGAIGGTLAMSRFLFWESFMVAKFKEAHVKAVGLSATVLDKVASDKFEGKLWCIDDAKPTAKDMCGLYKGTSGWGDQAYTTTYKSSELKHWNRSDSAFANFWFSPRSTVHTLAKPRTREGVLLIQQDVEINWEEGVELARYFYFTLLTAVAAKSWDVCLRGSLKLTIETTITFKAINSTGDLQVESTTQTTRKEYTEPNVRVGGLVSSVFPDGLHTLINDWANKLSTDFQAAKKEVESEVGKLEGLFGDVAEGLKKDLNQQNKFVFPGSGTFDMKDPIFSEKGDLMLGLTYR